MNAGGLDGRLIDGRFELLERLGGGGMGLVWRARDTMLQREVALKEVRAPDAPSFDADPQAAYVLRERVIREAQALARLYHPNVVTIHHIVDSYDQPHPWLVMELVTGGSLHDRLNRGPLSIPEAVRVGRGVLAALRAAHEAGIQHRDVKPGNVLLRSDGTPVLTDFGIAALQASPGLTATGMLVGSPEYMAPERIHGREGDPASDLWSLGLLLYVCLEGHNPLRRETTIATIAAVVDAPIPPPVRSGALAPVLAALLVRDPAQRPNAEVLDRMLADAQYAGPDRGMSTTMPVATLPVGRPVESVTTGAVSRRKPGGSGARLAPYITTLTVAAIAGGVFWAVHGGATAASAGHGGPSTSAILQNATGAGGLAPTTAAGPGVAAPAASTSSSSAPAVGNLTPDLLTPAGIRGMIQSLDQADGGTNVVEMDVYPDHASIEAVKASDHTEYDNYDVGNAGTATFSSTGETLDPGANTIDPSKVDWDALPTLIKDADAKCGVANPTDHYIILDSDLITQVPELLVYVSDSYGGGYVAATIDGTVTRIVTKD